MHVPHVRLDQICAWIAGDAPTGALAQFDRAEYVAYSDYQDMNLIFAHAQDDVLRKISWARFGVDRAARQILGSPLQRIETMGSYSCRNVAGTARRSAHSRAEAIDVSAFVLADGRRVSVLSGWNASREEREFLRVVHKSACKRFGTVLGPDYNRAHHDHFHLEYGKGNYCR